MYAEKKALWVEALRSKDYDQTTGTLNDKKGHCCLGVLCEVAIKDGLSLNVVRFGEERKDTYYDGDSAYLPLAVREWAGLESNNPYIGARRDGETEEEPEFLSGLNDSGSDFEDIATLIDNHL